VECFSTAQANAFSLIYGPSNFDQSSPSDTKINGVRIKGIGCDGRDKSQNRSCFSIRRTRGNLLWPPTIQPWLEAGPKIAEWYHSTAKKAKDTALNYSRLLNLLLAEQQAILELQEHRAMVNRSKRATKQHRHYSAKSVGVEKTSRRKKILREERTEISDTLVSR